MKIQEFSDPLFDQMESVETAVNKFVARWKNSFSSFLKDFRESLIVDLEGFVGMIEDLTNEMLSELKQLVKEPLENVYKELDMDFEGPNPLEVVSMMQIYVSDTAVRRIRFIVFKNSDQFDREVESLVFQQLDWLLRTTELLVLVECQRTRDLLSESLADRDLEAVLSSVISGNHNIGIGSSDVLIKYEDILTSEEVKSEEMALENTLAVRGIEDAIKKISESETEFDFEAEAKRHVKRIDSLLERVTDSIQSFRILKDEEISEVATNPYNELKEHIFSELAVAKMYLYTDEIQKRIRQQVSMFLSTTESILHRLYNTLKDRYAEMNGDNDPIKSVFEAVVAVAERRDYFNVKGWHLVKKPMTG